MRAQGALVDTRRDGPRVDLAIREMGRSGRRRNIVRSCGSQRVADIARGATATRLAWPRKKTLRKKRLFGLQNSKTQRTQNGGIWEARLQALG